MLKKMIRILFAVLLLQAPFSVPLSNASEIQLPRSGQTVCYDASGSVVSCLNTGQDGDIQAGLPWWPPTRFTDNPNGTVTDNLTGLIWLKNANCFGIRSWANAITYANALSSGYCGLTDGSAAGQWRLPTRLELDSLLDAGMTNPAIPAGHPFTNVQTGGYYWSSTTYANDPGLVWLSGIPDGSYVISNKTQFAYFWLVRGP